MTELKICSRLPGFWTCPSLCIPKRTGSRNWICCQPRLKWWGVNHSVGSENPHLWNCLEWMIEKLTLAQHAHKEGHQTRWNEASIENWYQQRVEEITIILDTCFTLCKKGTWIKGAYISKIYTITKVSWPYIRWCTHNLIYMPNAEN